MINIYVIQCTCKLKSIEKDYHMIKMGSFGKLERICVYKQTHL